MLQGSMVVCLGVMLFAVNALAETAADKGLSIAREADSRDSGWVDSSSSLTMILTNRHGEKRERRMRSMALEVPGDGDKRLITFEYPPDMRGTGFLSYSHKQVDDDQWLYLPQLKRVKRIASRSKSSSFLGSEFAYEDIAGQEVEKFTYRWLRDETYNGHACFVVESVPVDIRNSGYSKRISWIDRQQYHSWKIDYYDRKGRFFKTLTFSDYRLYLEKFWRPHTMEMVNHQSDNSTKLTWESYRFRSGLEAADFSQRSLKRAP